MQKVLFLIPSLQPSGAAKQLMLLASGLPREHFEVRVGVLGPGGLFAGPLRAAGVYVEALGWTRGVDPAPLLRLRQLVRSFGPDVIHAWGRWPLRLAGLFRRGNCLQVVSDPPTLGNPLDAWLLRRADQVVARGPAHADQLKAFCLAPEKVVPIPSAVDLPAPDGDKGDGRLLVCAGPLEARKGFREAIWAFDILKCLYDDLRLLIVGDGPERERLERFARSRGASEQIRFLPARTDVPAVLAGATAVWVPSRAEGGTNVALEAMAAGRPVVASRVPGLAEIVADGETGFLVPVGEQAGLARQTRSLLDDPGLRERMGRAGRCRVAATFAAEVMVERYRRLYAA